MPERYSTRIIKNLLCTVCVIFGGCSVFWDMTEFSHIELRASESKHAADTVRSIGENAEILWQTKGSIPSIEQLNCGASVCPPYTFLFNTVERNFLGIIVASHRKPGVLFTPTSQFTIYWNSLTRTTTRDHLQTEVSWLIYLSLSMLFNVAIMLIPVWTGPVFKAFQRRYGAPRSD